MRNRKIILLIPILVLALITAQCGRKRPPFLPKKEFPVKVGQLEAVWEDGAFHLKGTVIYPQDWPKQMQTISGCSVYHACYPPDNPPCEGCPLDLAPFQKIEGTVAMEKAFSCYVPMEKKQGIHFFKVRLIGEGGETGPFSDHAKVIITDQGY